MTEPLTEILDRISDGLVALDASWRYTYVNRTAAAMLRRTADDLIGKHVWTEFPETVNQPIYQACHQALGEQRPIRIEEYYPPWDRWFENRIYPSPNGVSIYFQDITERRKTAAAANRFQTLVEHSGDFIGVADLQGQGLYVNQAGCNLLGLESPDAVTTTNISDSIAEEDHALLRDVVLPRIFQDGRWSGEIRFRHWKTGRSIPLDCSGFLIKDATTGEPLCIATVSRDLSERKRAEEALKESTRWLSAILDHYPGFISAKDPTGTVILVNRNFSVLEGPSPEEFIGKNVFDLFPKDIADVLWRNDLAAQQAPGPLESEETVVHKDGSQHTYLTVKFPIREADQLVATGAISVDITERKRIEAALRNSEALLSDLIQSVEGIVWEADAKTFRFTFVSQQAERLLGYPLSLWIDEPTFWADPFTPTIARRPSSTASSAPPRNATTSLCIGWWPRTAGRSGCGTSSPWWWRMTDPRCCAGSWWTSPTKSRRRRRSDG